MDLMIKEAVVIEFLAKEFCEHKDIHNRLKNVSVDSVIYIQNVRRFMKSFGNGEAETADKQKSGRPTASVTVAILERVDEVIREDKRDTVQNTCDPLNGSYGSSQGIFTGSIRWSKSKTLSFFQSAFDAWVDRWHKCVQMHGDYVERYFCVEDRCLFINKVFKRDEALHIDPSS